MTARRPLSCAVLLLALLASPSPWAGAPNLLNYQGTLTTATGTAVNGQKTITFKLYNVATGGTALWTETQTVTLVEGRLAVVLGATTALPAAAFNGDTWLGLTVAPDTEMPRQRLTSVAYALVAQTAVNVQNAPVSIPAGVIVMWSGAVNAIPSGWALCNGQNGTPDLQNRFVVGAGSAYSLGARGGVASNNISHFHNISTESPSTNWIGDHAHSVDIKAGPTQENNVISADKGHSGWVVGEHYHYIRGNTGGAGGHDHTVTHSHGGSTGAAGSDNLENRPPYYALAFIMKL